MQPLQRAGVRRCPLLALLALISACSSEPAPPAATTPAATAAPAAHSATDAGRIVGTVQASGTAVVVLAPKSGQTFPPQGVKPVMDQVSLTFIPELLVVRTGQPAEFRNSDDVLHNVNVKHEETREQQFNVAIPTGGSFEHTFGRDGFYRVGCDIHPAMTASVFAATTPFTTVAGTDGGFAFDGVPPGPWTVTVYTGGKRLHKDVDVKGGVTEVTVE
jgi:plastocyanin